MDMSAFGHSRTCVQPNHAFIAPDGHVQSVLPGWTNTMGIILISPQMGARFCQYYAMMERGSASAPPSPGMQRFGYVHEGDVTLRAAGIKSAKLKPGSYFYMPANHDHEIKAARKSRLTIFEKPYTPCANGSEPRVIVSHEGKVKGEPFLGDVDARLQVLLPVEPAFDMGVNLFTFQRGTPLPFVETHVMEHGLLMLRGGGIYRLDDRWYPIAAGDVIWMGPYCPQWFLSGRETSTYLYYKDVSRDPLTMR